jgi:hypothetical protein
MGYNIGKRFLAYLEPMLFIILAFYGSSSPSAAKGDDF